MFTSEQIQLFKDLNLRMNVKNKPSQNDNKAMMLYLLRIKF